MFKSISILIVSIILVLAVNSIDANTFRLTNDDTSYTIMYSSTDSYLMVKTTIECINTLRRQHSEKRISKNTLIEYTNIAIRDLSNYKDVRIFEQ